MGATVRDDFIKKSKTEEDFVEKKGGDSFSGDRFLSRAKNHPLSKPMVDHDQERIKARGDREISDKIAGNLLEGVRRDGFNGRQGGYGRVCVDLVLLAKGTALNIAADKGGKSRPPEFGSNQLACFQEAGVAGRFMIMAAVEDGAAKGVIGRDVDTAFVGKDAGFNLPVRESRTEGEGNVLVHGLESLENEGITCGCGFNAIGEGSGDQVDKKGQWEEGDVGVVRVIRGEEIWAVGKGIGSCKEFSGDMDHFEVKVSEVNKPMRLAAVQRLGLSEIG